MEVCKRSGEMKEDRGENVAIVENVTIAGNANMATQYRHAQVQDTYPALVYFGRTDIMDFGGGKSMKVHYLKEASLEEDYVDVHYRRENESVEMIRNFFLSFHTIMGKKDDCVHKLYPGSIYYLEVVDRKLFAYQAKEVYQIEGSLGHFLDCYGESGFVQISKSTAVNIYQVGRVKADLNMRLRLAMENGEELVLNRNYKKAFLEALYRLQEVYHEVDR